MFAHLRKRLAELDAQIVEQRRALAELEQTRSDVERELHATAYPVLTLPVEITTEIFLQCHLVLGRLCFPNDYEGRNSTDLASVCSAWREIALATPILWSELVLRFHRMPSGLAPPQRPGLMEGCIDRRLTRARGCPLTLHIECRGTEGFPLSRLRDIIHRWSHRLQYLHLDIGGRDMSQLELDSVSFPLLHGVTLDCAYNPHLHRSRRLFADAPRFHDLCLLSKTEIYIPLEFSLPWLQLTKFEGALHDLSLFTLAPNLCEAISLFDPVGHSTVITHPNLRSLTTRADSRTDILKYLTLPGLQHLIVSYLPIRDSLVDFLSRSSPPLISLSVGEKYGTHFNNWARSLPSTLESLEIRDAGSADGLVDPSILDALPNLRTLIFQDVADGFSLL
ncbi:F-box domain-containing protein [Mycena venus]|uniref:F-box domain-containing protein n=1 Tax=Mycena venus TaxID=2733690 RepID=A0A8H7CYT4_9AGAR|nr:F-box domain-containing protein [Mycena venus]